ncbi:MAG: PA14 domain-containing protein [Myxococcota bacterium]
MKRLALIIFLPLVAQAQGLYGTYFAGRGSCPSLPADLKLARLDPAIDFTASGTTNTYNTASAGVPVTNFTARWSGTYEALSAGTHRFELEHNDEVMLTIDGTVVLSRPGVRATSAVPVDVVLTAGPHVFELCYVHTTGPSRIRVRHLPPGASAYAAIPPAQLSAEPTFKPAATSMNFDSLAQGTYLTTQLETSHGLRFSQVLGPAGFYYSKPRVVAAAPATTGSTPNVLRNESWDALEAMEISGNSPLRMAFVRAQSHLALEAGVQEQLFPTNPAAVLRGYDASGNIVAADRVAAVATSITSRLHLLRGAADLASVTVDFGDSYRDERLDGLRYEAFALAPIVSDSTPPAIEFISPTEGQMVTGAGGLSVTVRVREATSGLSSVHLETDGSTQLLAYDGTSDPACTPPTCQRYTGSLLLANGSHTLTVRAVDGAGNTGSASVRFGFTGVTVVRVVDEAARAVEGAEVYVDGRLHPLRTPASGELEFYPPLAVGTQLVARRLVHEHNTYRGNHAQGSSDNWNFRVYQTSVGIGNDGAPNVFRVSAPAARQELTVRASNGLVGAHLTASMNWHAGAQVEAVRERFRIMSDFLYNATDGQYFIERVDLFDSGRDWGNVDMRIFASNSLRAFVNWPIGGFLGWNLFGTAYMHLNVDDSGWTYAHEFGHYGLDLRDEYADGDANVRCTFRAGDPMDASRFSVDRSHTSCMMWNQGAAGKLCSNHGDNPHVRGTRQGDQSCWDHVVERYNGVGGLSLVTPTGRGAIPGNTGVAGPNVPWGGGVRATLQPPVPSWRPNVVTDLRSGELCPEFITRFTNADGSPAVMVPVYLHLASGGAIRQGLTDGDGNIRIFGAHRGDTLVTNGRPEAGADFVTDVGRMDGVTASKPVTTRTGTCPAPAAARPAPTPAVFRP